MERSQFVFCQLLRHNVHFRLYFLLLFTIKTSNRLLKLIQFGLQVVSACHLGKEASEVGSLLRGYLCSGGVGRGCAVTDGKDAVVSAVHVEEV